MLDNLKTTASQVATTVSVEDKGPTGEILEKKIAGVVRTRSANIIERVGWTAVQAFVGAFAAVLFATQELKIDNLKKAGLAGGSAVLAAITALIKNVITTRLEG